MLEVVWQQSVILHHNSCPRMLAYNLYSDFVLNTLDLVTETITKLPIFEVECLLKPCEIQYNKRYDTKM